MDSLGLIRSRSSKLNNSGLLNDAFPRDSGYTEQDLEGIVGEAGFCLIIRRALCQASSAPASQSGIGEVSTSSLLFDSVRSKRCARLSELEGSTVVSLYCWSRSVSTYWSKRLSMTEASNSLSLVVRIETMEWGRSKEAMRMSFTSGA